MKSYHSSNTSLHTFKLMSENKKLRAELSEHRYYLEQHVMRRTENMSLHIAMLESCNKTLCCKLTLLKKELVVLQAAGKKSVDNTAKLYLLSSAR